MATTDPLPDAELGYLTMAVPDLEASAAHVRQLGGTVENLEQVWCALVGEIRLVRSGW